MEKSVRNARERGVLAAGGLPHGHTFMLLMYLRGYENLIYDMADEDPRLWKLIEMVEGFNMAVINRFIDYGVEYADYGFLGQRRDIPVSRMPFAAIARAVFQRIRAASVETAT